MPESGTVCGLMLSLSTIVSVPVSVPVVAGVKVTVTTQLASDANPAPQLFVSVKFPLPVMYAMFKNNELVFLTVTAC